MGPTLKNRKTVKATDEASGWTQLGRERGIIRIKGENLSVLVIRTTLITENEVIIKTIFSKAAVPTLEGHKNLSLHTRMQQWSLPRQHYTQGKEVLREEIPGEKKVIIDFSLMQKSHTGGQMILMYVPAKRGNSK